MEKRIVETVNDKISNCKGCQNTCSCKILSNYIEEIGIEEFHKQLDSDTLPKHIVEIFDQKRQQLNL